MENESKYIRVGFLDVIQIVLIMFRIFSIIDWPWYKVLIPLWITIIITIIVAIIGTILDKKGY